MHGPGPGTPVPARTTRILAGVVGLLGAGILLGLVLLWPAGDAALPPAARLLVPGASVVHGSVRTVTPFACDTGGGEGAAPARPATCAHVRVAVDGHTQVTVEVAATVLARGLPQGSGVRLLHIPASAGAPEAWQFYDLERTLPLLALAALFALVTVAVARLRGLAAILGLAVGFLALFAFLLPGLLQGRNPLAVGVVGAAAILFVVVYLAHGVSARTTSALLGTVAGLVTSAVLAALAVRWARLTGAASDDELLLGSLSTALSLPGVVLCGSIVASLGAMNDVTVTQASAVWELYAVQPGLTPHHLFTAAMRIGRDHIASTVYTLAFAYAGAALPLLLLIELQQAPLGQAVTSEEVAAEIVRSLVGGVAVVLAVPLTTLIAVVVRTAGVKGDDHCREASTAGVGGR